METPVTKIEFGPFELDLARADLRRDGIPVELSAKPLRMLVYMAIHRDRVISKQELFDELWPDVAVGEAALSSALKDLRRALGDDGSNMRYIRTFRRRGYRFIAESIPSTLSSVRSEHPRTRPPRMVLRSRDDHRSWYRPPAINQPSPRPPFAGREEELRALRDSLGDAESGRPRVLLIEGDAGSGKTRLLEEFVATDCQFVDVSIGRAREGSARPYLAFAEALSSWMSERDIRLEDSVDKELLAVNRLLNPSQIGGVGAFRSRLVGERERSELMSGFSKTVIAFARRQPAVLILEDLQWADVSTIGLLEHLSLAAREAAEQSPVPLLIVCSARPDRKSENDGLLESLLRDDHCDRSTMAGLDESAVADIMDAMGFENPPASWVSSVKELSGGNPLFVQELTKHLREHGEDGLALPRSLEAALTARLSALSKDCRDVLALAALIGDSFGLLALSAASGRSQEETRKLLDQAGQAGIVSATRRAFRFEQRSWIHLLKKGLGARQRREMHAKIADVLEDLYASAGGEHAIEIANHVLFAKDEMDPARVLQCCKQAGEQSIAMYAWREAGRFFAAAADATTTTPDANRAELHLRAGIAFNHDWDAESYVRHYELAAAGFRRCGDHAGVAWALMYLLRARLTMSSADYGEKLDTSELVVIADRLHSSDPALRAMILGLLSEVAWMSGAKERGRRLAEEALVIGHNLESDEVCYRACMGLALTHFQSLRIREALESWREALRHAHALDSNWLVAPAAMREAMALIHLGRFDEADASLDEALATARRAHNLGELSFGSALRAVLRAARGDSEGASRAAEESINLMRRSRYPWGGPFAILATTVARALRGELRDAREGLQTLMEPGFAFDEPGSAVRLLVAVAELWIDALSNRPLDEERLTGLVTIVARAGQDSYLLGPACALVDVADRKRRVELVRPLEPLLRLACDRGIRFSSGMVFSIERMMAVFASESGGAEQALRFLEASIATTSEAGALPESVRAQISLARVLTSIDSTSSEVGVSNVDESGVREFDVGEKYRNAALAIAEELASPLLIACCHESAKGRAPGVGESRSQITP